MTWDGIPENWGKGHYRDVPICRYARLARERQVRDLKRALADDPTFPFYFDMAAADHAVWFASLLRHYEKPWTGQPFILADFQEWDIIRPLLGWKRKDDNTRRFRKAYKEMPRGQGKTTLDGFLALYFTGGDGEFGAQCYTTATKEAQARLLFDGARNLLKFNPDIDAEFEYVNGRLHNRFLGSYLRALGKDSKTDDGYSVHFGEVDEYHAHKTSGMLDVLESGTIKRMQPLISIITTAGEGIETPCRKESDYAKALLEGEHDNESYFAYITTVDDPEKWDQEEEWIKANPSWGISVNPTVFRNLATQAKQMPSKRHSFLMKNLNIWQQRASRWLTARDLDRCNGTYSWEKFRGMRCFGGLDLGITRDISAFALAFVEKSITIDERGNKILPDVFFLMRYWIPEECMYRRKDEDRVDYPLWVDQGFIKATDGATTRYDIIEEDIYELSQIFQIEEVAADQSHAYALMNNLADKGLNVVKHSQTIDAMTLPCKTFEEAVINAKINFNNDPVFRWACLNAAVIRGGDNRMKVAKDKSADKVDPLVAAIMALGRLTINPEPAFIYNSRGIYVAQ